MNLQFNTVNTLPQKIQMKTLLRFSRYLLSILIDHLYLTALFSLQDSLVLSTTQSYLLLL